MALSKKYPIVRPVVVVILNILDILFTYYLLNQQTDIQGANPIGKYFIGLGWGYAILFKMSVVIGGLAALMVLYSRSHKRAANWALNSILIIYIVVVINNSLLFFI